MQGIHHPAGHQEACLRGLADLDHRGPTSVAPGMPALWGSKSKAAQSRHVTGGSISQLSRLEAFDERGYPPPLNAMECGK